MCEWLIVTQPDTFCIKESAVSRGAGIYFSFCKCRAPHMRSNLKIIRTNDFGAPRRQPDHVKSNIIQGSPTGITLA